MQTILIIEDNETIREGLAHTVKKLGHDPVVAGGGPGVGAIKLGACDSIPKPIQPEVVRLKTQRALELCAARRGRRKADALTDYLSAEADGHFPPLLGPADRR